MRILHRYALLLLSSLLFLYLLYNTSLLSTEDPVDPPPSFWTQNGELSRAIRQFGDLPCSFHSCFDFSRCRQERLKVYVYPSLEGDVISAAYSKILQAVRESAYYTNNPLEACLFILSVDTIDRDKISENYVRDVNELIDNLPPEIWNGGLNHVIFNLYHGTFPDYADHNLGFNSGKAIIARASPSVQHFRFGFDVSFPLFHKEHSLRSAMERMYQLHAADAHLVSFKGKRYVYGIGSETRDALHYIHNGQSVPMVTTCKHNNDWKEHQDDRCERDNAEYDKWDYESMMVNSTFCLTPRGRRLGSFRFLESLRAGCIPVVLSDDWVLPFDEVIDWSQAAVVIAEENVLLVPGILADIPPLQVVTMKEHGRFLYNRYFRDVESIALSCLRIIFDRVRRTENRATRSWTTGVTSIQQIRNASVTVLMQASPKPSKSLQTVFRNLAELGKEEVEKVFVVWPEERGVPPVGADFGTSLRVEFIEEKEKFPYPSKLQYPSGLFLWIDERTAFEAADVLLILQYLKEQPQRLIGLHGIDFDPTTSSLKFSGIYNALFPSVVGFHGSYIEELQEHFPATILASCPMEALNLLVSDLSMQPPLVLGSHSPQLHMQMNADCWKQVISRWDFNPPLFYSSLHFV